LVVGRDGGNAAEVSVFDAVAVSFECDDLGVVDEAVDHGCGDDVIAEHFAPSNWSWHMFAGAETACQLGFPVLCVSYRSSRLNGDMLGTA
jgi:hypothetical protein